jgi:signal transduction histidine kinase
MTSLSRRLIRGLLLVQVATILSVAVLVFWTSVDRTPSFLTHDRATLFLVDAVVQGGGRAIAETEALIDFRNTHPGFLYGVRLGDEWLDGSLIRLGITEPSSQDMVVTELIAYLTRGDRTHEVVAGRVTVPLPDGPTEAVIATSATNAVFLDIVNYIAFFGVTVIALFGPVILMSLIAIVITVRRVTGSLRKIADDAARIDLDRLDRRVDARDAPAEIAPLVQSFNVSLRRLQTGYAERRRFLDDATHELRTPIAILRARIDELSDTPSRALLQRDARRLSSLADQLLESARLQAGSALHFECVDLADVARQTVADLAPLAHKLGLELEVRVDARDSRVAGSRNALMSLLSNLVSNALRFEPQGGVVSVVIGAGPRLMVEDHGPGLTEDEVAHAFLPFWRAPDSGKGTGLGLAIVHEIARAHAAQVHVEATPGGGARFVVDFSTAGPV